MSNPRFIMVGGFLGAGKTSTISRLAAHYQSLGNRVVIVTNDQAADLVDTNLLRSQGFDVGEVAGSCFCCNFNELTSTVERLGKDARPDVVIAEPVGSCTDLVATVIRPLEQIYSVAFDIAPYGVIVKPSHGRRILSGQQRAGFSPQAEYIFRKQIEEADFVMVNRVDELQTEQVNELADLIEREYPSRQLVRMSAKTGAGFDDLIALLDSEGDWGKRVMDVDYDVYAEGEAELGWLNAQVQVTSETTFALDAFLVDLLAGLQVKLSSHDAETAHSKAIGMSEGYYAVANLINSFDAPQLSLASDANLKSADLVLNARVAIDPDSLTAVVEQVLTEVCGEHHCQHSIKALQCFKPGRPVPTHRLN
ncbi:MAG: GTP-binding protein [Pirellulaceae bacterium]